MCCYRGRHAKHPVRKAMGYLAALVLTTAFWMTIAGLWFLGII